MSYSQKVKNRRGTVFPAGVTQEWTAERQNSEEVNVNNEDGRLQSADPDGEQWMAQI